MFTSVWLPIYICTYYSLLYIIHVQKHTYMFKIWPRLGFYTIFESNVRNFHFDDKEVSRAISKG